MREEIERRLLVVACIGAILGIAIKAAPLNALFLPAFVWYVRPPTARALAAAACLMGMLVAQRPAPAVAMTRGFFRGEVAVVTMPRKTRGGSSCNVRSADALMDMRLRGGTRVALGDRIWIEAPTEPPNEAETDAFRAQGLTCRCRPFRLKVLRKGPALFRWAETWRQALLDLTEKSLPPRAAAATDALCFNVEANIDQDTLVNLRRTGTIHVVSASGLHVVIVAFALMWMLARLPFPRWAQLLCLACALVLYAAGSGLQPPVVRAALMTVVVLAAYIVRREPDWPSALALAALLYIVWSPSSVATAGFQLSFAAIAGLGLFRRHFPAGRGVWGRAWAVVRNAAHVSFVASVASAPLVAYHFGMVSIASVPANVLIGIAVAPIVVGAMAATALLSVWPAMSMGLMRVVVEPLSGWFLWVVDGLGSIRLAAVDVPPFSAYWLLPVYAAMLLLWRKRARQA
jgi:competence protein ComEC